MPTISRARVRSRCRPALVKGYVKTFLPFPAYLVNFFKYPCMISDVRFRRDFRGDRRVDMRETIATTVLETRGAG